MYFKILQFFSKYISILPIMLDSLYWNFAVSGFCTYCTVVSNVLLAAVWTRVCQSNKHSICNYYQDWYLTCAKFAWPDLVITLTIPNCKALNMLEYSLIIAIHIWLLEWHVHGMPLSAAVPNTNCLFTRQISKTNIHIIIDLVESYSCQTSHEIN